MIKKRSEKVGFLPGTLVHIGEKKAEEPKITIIDYDEMHFQEKEIKKIEECLPFKDKSTVTWINDEAAPGCLVGNCLCPFVVPHR